MKAPPHACDSLHGVSEGEGIFEVAYIKKVGLMTTDGDGEKCIFKISPCRKLNPCHLHERPRTCGSR